MYRVEFEKLIKNNPPRAILLYGDNSYLIDSYINFYIKITNSSDSLRRVYFDEYDFNSAKSYLLQTSLFGGVNMLIIKRDKKIPKREMESLLELVSKSSSNYLIFEYIGDIKDIKSIQTLFSLKNGAVWVRVFETDIKQSIRLLQKRAKLIGLDIDNYALQHLLITLNSNLSLSIKELDKLAILNRRVTMEDIDRLVYSTAPLALERLFIELFNKRPIIETLKKLFESGEDEFSILRAIQLFINQIFLFSTYMRLNGGAIDSKAILGYRLPKEIESQKANLAHIIEPNSLLKIFKLLLDVELNMKKSSPKSRDTLLIATFIKIQSSI